VIERKGIRVAVEVARATGRKLVLAGQLDPAESAVLDDPCVEYVGLAHPEMRARLMAEAHCLIQPTIFMEPFGGNVVEAALCGTPAITTDYAAFAETVVHGRTGYRCQTLEQFVWAVENADKLDRKYARDRAVANYSLEKIGGMYDEYFAMQSDLWHDGWSTARTRDSLKWLDKF
jgi:glycosyltransferase involved in cell wall biosynthesis